MGWNHQLDWVDSYSKAGRFLEATWQERKVCHEEKCQNGWFYVAGYVCFEGVEPPTALQQWHADRLFGLCSEKKQPAITWAKFSYKKIIPPV